MRWQDLVKDGEIHIPPPVWEKIKATRRPPEARALISEAIEKGRVPVPLPPRSWEAAQEDFQRLLAFSGHDLFDPVPWEGSYTYRYPLLEETVGFSRVGLLSSDYFHQEPRWRCNGRGYPSAFRTWETPKYRDTLLKALWTLGHKQVGTQELRHCLSVRKYVASQFRPTVAKAFYERFGARRVLDFSAGWGDRLSAALATNTVEHYTGVDPNHRLHRGYRQQVERYNRDMREGVLALFGESFVPKDLHFLCCPAEEMELEDRAYDLVFTSPPYFDKERYTDDDTQSWVRYKTVEGWLEGFLFEAIRRAWGHLEPGGHLAVNISDALSKDRETGSKKRRVDHLCDPMNDLIGALPGAEYVGAIGMRMGARLKRERARSFFEPIWVWRRRDLALRK